MFFFRPRARPGSGLPGPKPNSRLQRRRRGAIITRLNNMKPGGKLEQSEGQAVAGGSVQEPAGAQGAEHHDTPLRHQPAYRTYLQHGRHLLCRPDATTRTWSAATSLILPVFNISTLPRGPRGRRRRLAGLPPARPGQGGRGPARERLLALPRPRHLGALRAGHGRVHAAHPGRAGRGGQHLRVRAAVRPVRHRRRRRAHRALKRALQPPAQHRPLHGGGLRHQSSAAC